MKIYVDFEGITGLFEHVEHEKRDVLFEHEVYELIRLAGAETLPHFTFHAKDARLTSEHLNVFPGEMIVVKIVSPYIVHKSDVGGVRVVPKELPKVLSAVRGMLAETPERYARIMERHPASAPTVYRGLDGERLKTAIAGDIRGLILCQYIPPGSSEFGKELIVSLRRSREFGMIISAGLGGTDTELYAETLKKGQAVVAAATAMTDGETFFRLYQQTISYKKLAGLTRSHQRMVTDEQLRECFSAFIAVANHFSPLNVEVPFVIEELEINPFAFADYLMLPLDGLCRIARPAPLPISRPLAKIDKLLHPATIGIIGVSARETNFGRIIMDNILANGFNPERLVVFHPDVDQINGVRALADLSALQGKLDLMILAVSAAQVEILVEQIITADLAESVLLIPAGMGEKKGSEARSQTIKHRICQAHAQSSGGPVFLGGNSLGVLSHPGRYDALFVPDAKLPKDRGDHIRDSAFISQSGAYMITRMSKLAFLDPAYAISIGNQIDLTAGDLVLDLIERKDIHIIASYMEGFQDLDGLAFAKAVRKAILNGKEVLFYKAGRTPEGRSATSGHTASLAGDYMVCESCIRQAGAMVASTFTGFEGLYRLAKALHRKTVAGNRLAAVSNAGYEAVGIADNIWGEDFRLEMATLSAGTRDKLAQVLKATRIDSLVDVRNPMDLTPMATEAVYELVTQILLEDEHVDAVVVALVPLTPLMQTLPEGVIPHETLTNEDNIVQRMSRLFLRYAKPLVLVIDSGSMYDPLADAFQGKGLPVFRSADQAVWILGKYIQGRLNIQQILAQHRMAGPADASTGQGSPSE